MDCRYGAGGLGYTLCLDTTNIEAMEAGLRTCRGRALVNSISARPERMKALMPLAKEYGAGFIGLTLGAEGIPRDADERGFLAEQSLRKPQPTDWTRKMSGLILLPFPSIRSSPQVQSCDEFVAMLSHLAPRGKSTCGLSNVSNGTPGSRRGLLNRTYLVMLKRYGLYSVIANAFDDELRANSERRTAGNRCTDLQSDGRRKDRRLGPVRKKAGYVKTARVLLGEKCLLGLMARGVDW